MLFIIDRLDYTDSHTRIVDYKTGSDATSFSNMQQLFDLGGANPAGAIFQLMTYALCYENEYGPRSDLDIAICRPAVLETNGYSYELQYKDTKLDYAALKEEFRSGLIERMKRLFSPDEDFKQFKPGISSASGPCDYCDYKSLCGKK
jgi:RecB family exonuclease